MGKRKDLTTLQLEDLRYLDHAVFGQMVIARQSSSEIKEASMFVEKPAPEHRKLEKTKSDNTMELQRRTVCRGSGSLTSEISEDGNRISYFKYKNGYEVTDDRKIKNISIRNWHSTELPAMAKQRKISRDYFNRKPKSPTSEPRTTEHNILYRSSPQICSLSASASTEVLPSCNRHLSSTSRKPLSFYGSPSLSRESSIEEEKEIDSGSSASENCTGPRTGSGGENRRRVSQLVDELLLDIYRKWYGNGFGLPYSRRHSHSTNSSAHESDYCSASDASAQWRAQAHLPGKGASDSLQLSRLKFRSE
jgi:hypothetical protein